MLGLSNLLRLVSRLQTASDEERVSILWSHVPEDFRIQLENLYSFCSENNRATCDPRIVKERLDYLTTFLIPGLHRTLVPLPLMVHGRIATVLVSLEHYLKDASNLITEAYADSTCRPGIQDKPHQSPPAAQPACPVDPSVAEIPEADLLSEGANTAVGSSQNVINITKNKNTTKKESKSVLEISTTTTRENL